MRTPPGVTPQDFAAALEQFSQVVGTTWVFSKDEDVELYRDAFSPFLGEPEERWASAAVAPAEAQRSSGSPAREPSAARSPC